MDEPTPPIVIEDPGDDPVGSARPRLLGTRIAEALERASRPRAAPSTDTWTDDMFREQRDRDLEVRTVSAANLLRATLVTLVLAMLLTSAKLVEIAERQPLGGQTRAFWLPIAEDVDRVANFLSLNRPADLVADIRGTGDAAGQTDDDFDDLVDKVPEPAPTTTTAPAGVSTTLAPPTTTSSIPAVRTVTADDPLRVLFAGDSQAEFPGQSLQLRIDEGSLPVTAELDARISTGLARPDVFNWGAQLLAAASRDRPPEAFVVLLGANDNQDMVDSSGDVLSRLSPEWRGEYAARVAIVMDLLSGPGQRVLWVSQPPMRDGSLDEAMRVVNEIAEAEAAPRPWVRYVNIYDLFSAPGGGYARDIPDPDDGGLARVRRDDGVHLDPTGSAWLSERLVVEIAALWPSVQPG